MRETNRHHSPAITPADPLPASTLQRVLLHFCPCLALAITLGTVFPVQAQMESQRVLFDPVPIPANENDVLPLVTIDEAVSGIGSINNGAMTLAERRALEQQISSYVESIGDQESEEGPYSTQLVQDLFSAGNLSQQLGDHEQAMDFFQRAQSVIRINEGLETLSQIPIMEAMVASTYAQGKLREADDLQDALFSLKQGSYGERSVSMVPTMINFGQWHMDAFLERSNILLNVDRMNVVRFMSDPGNYIHEYDPRDTPLMNLYTAQETLLNAIDILVSKREYFHPQMLEAERLLLKSYLLSMHRENILYEPDFYLTRKKRKTGSRLNTNSMELNESREYKLGQSSHNRTVTFIRNDPDLDPGELARAMLEAADWHLLFERKVKAADEYQAVYDYFADIPQLAASVQDILYPSRPVVLPTYLPPPNSREKLDIGPNEPVDYFGYFDVSFRVDKFGKAKRIKILDQGGDISSNLEIRMKQYLRKVLFRPFFKDGEPDTSTRTYRYYVGL